MDLSGIEALRIVQRPGVDTEGREILAIVAAKARENGSRAALLHAPRTLAVLLSLPSMSSKGCVCLWTLAHMKRMQAWGRCAWG